MSYEGYEELICSNGHYWQNHNFEIVSKCPYCQGSAAYQHNVDVTNEYDESQTYSCNAPKTEIGYQDEWKIDHYGNKYAIKIFLYKPDVTIWRFLNGLLYLTDNKRHLICLPYSIDNLHKMADNLNINRCWFHKHHYDIPLYKQKEVQDKCVIISTRKIVDIIKKERVKDTL